MKKFLIIFGIILSLAGCRTTQYVPITGSTETNVHVIDSVAIHYLDSIRYFEATRYKEMGWLNDTLKVKTERGTEVTVYADTTKELLSAEVKEPPIESKTHIEYRDRVEYRDSVRTVEKPVPYPVEVEKKVKYTPWYNQVLSAIGLISLLVLLGYLGIKIWKLKGKEFLGIIKGLFK